MIEGPAVELAGLQLERYEGADEEDLRSEKAVLEGIGRVLLVGEGERESAESDDARLEKEAARILYEKGVLEEERFRKHETILRSWNWHDVKPHSSLLDKISQLDEVSRLFCLCLGEEVNLLSILSNAEPKPDSRVDSRKSSALPTRSRNRSRSSARGEGPRREAEAPALFAETQIPFRVGRTGLV